MTPPAPMGAPPLLFVVLNVTAHPSNASVPTSYYSMWHLLLHGKTVLGSSAVVGGMVASTAVHRSR